MDAQQRETLSDMVHGCFVTGEFLRLKHATYSSFAERATVRFLVHETQVGAHNAVRANNFGSLTQAFTTLADTPYLLNATYRGAAQGFDEDMATQLSGRRDVTGKLEAVAELAQAHPRFAAVLFNNAYPGLIMLRDTAHSKAERAGLQRCIGAICEGRAQLG